MFSLKEVIGVWLDISMQGECNLNAELWKNHSSCLISVTNWSQLDACKEMFSYEVYLFSLGRSLAYPCSINHVSDGSLLIDIRPEIYLEWTTFC